MAKELTIYPSADVTLNHSKYPSSSQSGYVLIYDATPDDDTSYIYHSLSTSSSTKSSTFKCDNTNVTGKIYLRSISYLVRTKYTSSNATNITATITPSVSVNGKTTKNGTQANTTTSYVNNSGTFSGVTGVDAIYNSITDANIVLGLSTTGVYTSGSGKSGSSASIYITQANLTISYDDVFDCAAYAVSGSGIKTVSVDKSEVVDGGTATFKATLNNKVTFVGWYSDAECNNLVSTSQTYTATITENTTLYARGSSLYSISVVADENSTVSTTHELATAGTSVTVTATPKTSNYSFDGWYSNEERTTLVSDTNPYTFTVSADITLYAKTKLNELMYVKIGGVWVACSKVYKKIDGNWVEQTILDGLFDTSNNYKINEV